jgi:hypothetical protein
MAALRGYVLVLIAWMIVVNRFYNDVERSNLIYFKTLLKHFRDGTEEYYKEPR